MVELALGVAMSATSVRLALVDIADEDGRVVDCDEFALPTAGNDASPSVTESVVSAILGTQAIAAAGGHNLVSIGLSWQGERESDVTTVLESMSDLGFRNLTSVSALECAEALAKRIAGTTKFDAVAVCIVEPQAVFQCVLQTGDTSQTQLRTFDSGDTADVASRLAVGMDASPDAFVVVGSDPATDSIAQSLAAVVTGSVITTPRREFALARGAAFAAARPAVCLGQSAGTEQLPEPALFVSRATRLAAMSELLEPVEVPVPQQPRLNVGSLTSVLVAAVAIFSMASFMLITGEAEREPAKVERRQVVETLVSSAKPVPAELPPAQELPAPPPPVVHAAPPPPAVVQPGPQQWIPQAPAPNTQWSAPQQAAVPPPINPGFDAAVRAIQDWWLAQQPPPPPPAELEPAPGFQPFNPFAPPA